MMRHYLPGYHYYQRQQRRKDDKFYLNQPGRSSWWGLFAGKLVVEMHCWYAMVRDLFMTTMPRNTFMHFGALARPIFHAYTHVHAHVHMSGEVKSNQSLVASLFCGIRQGVTLETRNVFKKKTGRRIMGGEFHYRLIEISYNSERPNNILSNKVNK